MRYSQVIVKVRDVNDIDAVKDAIDGRMNRRDDVVNVMDTRRILESIFSMYESVTVFLMGIGAISLLVAGVSILNVMMMSVTERTREIGVLRSIGTRRSELMRIFIYESLILGSIGAVTGGLLSLRGRLPYDGSLPRQRRIPPQPDKPLLHRFRDEFRGRDERSLWPLSGMESGEAQPYSGAAARVR